MYDMPTVPTWIKPRLLVYLVKTMSMDYELHFASAHAAIAGPKPVLGGVGWGLMVGGGAESSYPICIHSIVYLYVHV